MTSNEPFLGILRTSSRKRVDLTLVKTAFYQAYPGTSTSSSRNQQLLDVLRELEASALISLPAVGSWEKVGNPPMPSWIQLVREDTAQPRLDYSSTPWVPEMGFWTELKPAALEGAKAINDFLLRKRTSLRLVPIKERSLEIFGDEKRLDAMRTGDALFGGRLPISAIGAFQVPLPLPYRSANAPGKPVLVVENHNSFWSFGEWNKTAKRYSAVVYGSGNEFRSSGAAMGQVLAEVGGVGAEYLGDLDPAGIRIPYEFNGASATARYPVRPALDLYRWLLVNGRRREKPEFASADPVHARAWLGDEFGNALAAVWARGWWIPQEGLGCEQLSSFEG